MKTEWISLCRLQIKRENKEVEGRSEETTQYSALGNKGAIQKTR